MNKDKFKIFAGILIIFLLGAATGSLVTNIYFKKEFRSWKKGKIFGKRGFLIDELSQKLDLTATQKQEIEKIMEESFEKIFQLKRKHRPEIKEIFKKRNALIKEKLNDEQKEKFDELVVVMKQMRRKWRKEKSRWKEGKPPLKERNEIREEK
jgi:hypothetical protein